MPLVSTLLVLMVLDIFAGVLVAVNKRTLNSSISFKGMTKKTFIIILVGLAMLLEPFSSGTPLGKLVSLFYIVMEAISILENAGALGVPIPRALKEVLQKLREDKQKKSEQKLPDPGKSTTVTTVTTKVNTDTKL